MQTDIVETLRTHFGFETFRPGQYTAIQHLLDGRHTLVVMPTGAGKSLIYQLAALYRPGLTLVISPLIALMQDQVQHLAQYGIAATCINSTLPADEQASRLRAMAEGAFQLVYIAPERLRNSLFQQALRNCTVGLLAVDEAHCISQWGHDFRPDYMYLATARAAMDHPLTVALTATATTQVQQDIIQNLGLPDAAQVITGFNRPNLTFEVQSTPDLEAKLRALHDLLLDLDEGAAIVYVGTRREAEEVAEFISSILDLCVPYYHAGIDPDQRAQVQAQFCGGELPVVVATSAFGMGIDRADVRLVVHFSLPGTLEAYYQEAGRAGRDGAAARVVLLYAPQDRALQEWFIEQGAPADSDLQQVYTALAAPGQEQIWTTLEDLTLSTSLPEVKLRVVLAQLEQCGCITRLGDHGRGMLFGLHAWNQTAIRLLTVTVTQYQRRRREQLDQMISYAESNTCRRRLILNHFSDHTPADASHCCDNCLTQPTDQPPQAIAHLSQAERVALIILDALRRLRWEVGREKLAQILKGSRAKGVAQREYQQHIYYSRLEVFALSEIEEMIGQLIAQGYLRAVGGTRPVLRLTPRGYTALRQREGIPLRLPRVIQAAEIDRKKAERAAGGTVELTAQMFATNLTPAQIAARRGLSEDTIYNHLARLIGQGQVTLAEVLPEALVSQIRAVIERIGDCTALAPIKMRLPDTISYGQIQCVVADWQQTHHHTCPPAASPPTERVQRVVELGNGHDASQDQVTAFLSRAHPRPLPGPWQAGWSLGFHSQFNGATWHRTNVGTLAHRLKYQHDQEAVQPLLEQILALCSQQPDLVAGIDALVPVPPSPGRLLDPVETVARHLGIALKKPIWPLLTKTRQTAPQKELRTLAQKRANVAGAFTVRYLVPGKRLLVLDDLFDSGATLEEVSRVLRQAGVTQLSVLTLTRTIHTDA